MQNPQEISISAYTYPLPPERIAIHPLDQRDASKLLINQGGTLHEDVYQNIAAYLPADSLLVFNNTKVVEARIEFRKPTGARIEIFCLEPPAEYGGIANALARTGTVNWRCLIGGASKWKPGQILRKELPDGLVLEARYLERSGDSFLIALSWTPAQLSFGELLHRAGAIPLPPYIHREADAADSRRYQTIYAQHDGSVAAPTAGLHFTDAIFQSLAAKKISHDFVTLHVGAGTFLPVKAATLGGHTMHIEYIDVSRDFILRLRTTLKAGKPVIAVGTTSARTLESLYWLGLAGEDLVVRQWDPYTVQAAATAVEALTSLLDRMARQGIDRLVTTTQLLISPGYEWRIVTGLVTNFHQPESTLLLLIASLIGEDWRKMYSYALEHDFRFLSYGDGCLLLPASSPGG